MKYWVYINDKVVGPYEEANLASLEGFTPDTLICKDGSQNWVKASSLFDFDPPAAQQAEPAQTAQANTTATTTANTAVNTTAAAGATFDAAAAQILIEKIDLLTKEIEGMKAKLEQTWQASAATQAALEQMKNAPVAAAPAPAIETVSIPTENTATEDASLTDTQNLVSHAEQVVAQAGTEKTEEKPLDFLNEIRIGDSPADNAAEEKGGEE